MAAGCALTTGPMEQNALGGSRNGPPRDQAAEPDPVVAAQQKLNDLEAGGFEVMSGYDQHLLSTALELGEARLPVFGIKKEGVKQVSGFDAHQNFSGKLPQNRTRPLGKVGHWFRGLASFFPFLVAVRAD